MLSSSQVACCGVFWTTTKFESSGNNEPEIACAVASLSHHVHYSYHLLIPTLIEPILGFLASLKEHSILYHLEQHISYHACIFVIDYSNNYISNLNHERIFKHTFHTCWSNSNEISQCDGKSS